MTDKDLGPRDLNSVFGTQARTNDVLSGRRRLSLNHIRVLVFNFGMDADILIKQYQTVVC